MEKSVLQNLIAQGLSIGKIAKVVDLSISTVAYWIRKHGLRTAIMQDKLDTTPEQRADRKRYTCVHCGSEDTVLNRSKYVSKKYCNSSCQMSFEYDDRITRWKAGTLSGVTGEAKSLRGWLRRYMLEKHNYSCVKCGWCKRHPVDNLPLVEVNHIDGDADNCCEENLEVICPNCHSETHNFRARNKASSRNRSVKTGES